jgi:hypothetical protein
MFVSDSNIFTSDHVKLSVISLEGLVWNIDASPDISVDELKIMALCHFINPLECMNMISNWYKLYLVSERRLLDNDNSVLQEGLRDNGDYCLAVRVT